jgi:hypothetical protein
MGDPDITNSQVYSQIDRLNSGKDVAAVSYLVLLEVIEVIRNKVIQREHFNGVDQIEIDRIKEKANLKVKEFIDYITQLSTEGKVQILNSKVPFEEHLERSIKELRSIDFRIYNYHKCKICKQPIDPVYAFKGLGQTDIQHAIIAKNIQCDEIVSADQWFNTLKGKKEFADIKITTIK